jgi:hypothetical protein
VIRRAYFGNWLRDYSQVRTTGVLQSQDRSLNSMGITPISKIKRCSELSYRPFNQFVGQNSWKHLISIGSVLCLF